uniref:Uncharacterized protein n=1 Tax=Oryza punctata TaxID=4537 RepID=A0A0E0JYD8_ORYPU
MPESPPQCPHRTPNPDMRGEDNGCGEGDKDTADGAHGMLNATTSRSCSNHSSSSSTAGGSFHPAIQDSGFTNTAHDGCRGWFGPGSGTHDRGDADAGLGGGRRWPTRTRRGCGGRWWRLMCRGRRGGRGAWAVDCTVERPRMARTRSIVLEGVGGVRHGAVQEVRGTKVVGNLVLERGDLPCLVW